MTDRVTKIVATFFYVGLIPWAPGTMGSLAGLLLCVGLYSWPLARAVTFVLLTALGFLVAGRAESLFGKKDPSSVIIDEVSGIFLVFFMIPLKEANLLFGFLLYRFFDIFKPFPARRLERLPGSLGIMGDDLLCGIYANLALRALIGLNILH